MPELDSEDASLGWGPLTASNFSADFQVIAASGAGLVTYSTAEIGNPNISVEQAQISNPSDVDLFSRQVATDNSSMVTNHTDWVPQVGVPPNACFNSCTDHNAVPTTACDVVPASAVSTNDPVALITVFRWWLRMLSRLLLLAGP